jgi:hypothetical protein
MIQPLPWTCEEHKLCTGFSSIIYDANGHSIHVDGHMHIDLAAFIVRACNAHDALLAAAKSLEASLLLALPEEIVTSGELDRLQTAIAKAEEHELLSMADVCPGGQYQP